MFPCFWLHSSAFSYQKQMPNWRFRLVVRHPISVSSPLARLLAGEQTGGFRGDGAGTTAGTTSLGERAGSSSPMKGHGLPPPPDSGHSWFLRPESIGSLPLFNSHSLSRSTKARLFVGDDKKRTLGFSSCKAIQGLGHAR